MEQGDALLCVAGIPTQVYFILNTSASPSRSWGPATDNQGLVPPRHRVKAACRENKQPALDLSCWELSSFTALSLRRGD